MSNLSTPLQIAGQASAGQEGLIRLTADLGGTFDAPSVLKINGIAVTGSPSAGQVLTATSSTAAAWTTPAGSSSSAKRVVTGTWASTYTPNGATTDILRLVLGGNTAFATPSGTPVDGQQLQLILVQDGTGGRTASFASAGFAFSTDIPAPTLSTAANATDVLGFQYSTAASKWRLLGVVKGF